MGRFEISIRRRLPEGAPNRSEGAPPPAPRPHCVGPPIHGALRDLDKPKTPPGAPNHSEGAPPPAPRPPLRGAPNPWGALRSQLAKDSPRAPQTNATCDTGD